MACSNAYVSRDFKSRCGPCPDYNNDLKCGLRTRKNRVSPRNLQYVRRSVALEMSIDLRNNGFHNALALFEACENGKVGVVAVDRYTANHVAGTSYMCWLSGVLVMNECTHNPEPL